MYDDSRKGRNVFESEKGRSKDYASSFQSSFNLTLAVYSFRLIPSDLTAIEVGLSHASRTTRTMSGSGTLLSNT